MQSTNLFLLQNVLLLLLLLLLKAFQTKQV